MAGDKGSTVRDQLSAVLVDRINSIRIDTTDQFLNAQDSAFRLAIAQIDKVRVFIGSPEKILGNPSTKHGEIAEQVEVGIRNARSLLEQKGFVATFEGVGRTAPEDYLLDGIAVQSKFINGASKGLDHVLEHMDKYKHFGRNGSYYQIPKDQYETITGVMNGDNGPLNDKSVRPSWPRSRKLSKRPDSRFRTWLIPAFKITQTLSRAKSSKP